MPALTELFPKLVIDKSLSALPRRKTDNAIIIRAQDAPGAKAQVFKLNADPDEPVLVERYRNAPLKPPRASRLTHMARRATGGHERQYRFRCTRCQLLIGYQSTPPPAKSGPFLYILSGALSQVQGKVPEDAFDGEQGNGDD